VEVEEVPILVEIVGRDGELEGSSCCAAEDAPAALSPGIDDMQFGSG
jgi:hypothetical protein